MIVFAGSVEGSWFDWQSFLAMIVGVWVLLGGFWFALTFWKGDR